MSKELISILMLGIGILSSSFCMMMVYIKSEKKNKKVKETFTEKKFSDFAIRLQEIENEIVEEKSNLKGASKCILPQIEKI